MKTKRAKIIKEPKYRQTHDRIDRAIKDAVDGYRNAVKLVALCREQEEEIEKAFREVRARLDEAKDRFANALAVQARALSYLSEAALEGVSC